MNEFVWVGGRPALDLCNTIVGGRDLFATPTDIYEWLQEADTQSCECMFVPTLLDAIELARDDIARVRLCAADACSMIYLDASRNGSRRWCSMERCGARAKAHAYYERKRGRA